jgi:hypothetical protein
MSLFEILIIIGIIVSMMSKAAAAAAKRSPSPPPDDLEQAERLRRIREEIRRKIVERRGGLTQPAAELSPPAAEGTPPAFPWPGERVPPLDPFGGRTITRTAPPPVEQRAPEPPLLPARPSAVLERQEEVASQLAALQEEQAAAQATAVARASETSWTESTRTASGPSAWRNDLRSRADLRRAIVLRELLGPPVALR